MSESRNLVEYSKLGNPLPILTWQHNGQLELSEAVETQEVHALMYMMKVETHV
jgi:hypothetical protein